MKKFDWLIAAICSLAAIAPAQTTPSLIARTPAEREAQQKANQEIFLNVLVADAAGHPVAGLAREKFTLLDDQQPQKIVMFREIDGPTRPVHVLIVLDAINTDAAIIRHIRADLAHYLSRSQEPLPYPLSVVLLSKYGQTESTPSTDRAALIQTLAQIPKNTGAADCYDVWTPNDVDSRMGGSPGNSAAARAVFTPDCLRAHFEQSVKAFFNLLNEQARLQGRALCLWTGPGWPLAKRVIESYHDELIDLTTDLRSSQTTLYAVSPMKFNQPGDTSQPSSKTADTILSVRDPSARDQAALASLPLPILAEESGGRAFEKTKLGDVLDTCFADVSRYYLISYYPSPSAAPDTLRSIAVRINRPGVQARTTTSWFAQP